MLAMFESFVAKPRCALCLCTQENNKQPILNLLFTAPAAGAFLVGPLSFVDFFLAEHLHQLETLLPGLDKGENKQNTLKI